MYTYEVVGCKLIPCLYSVCVRVCIYNILIYITYICDLSRENVAYAEIINFEKTGVFCNFAKSCRFLLLCIFAMHDNCSTSRRLHFCQRRSSLLVMTEKTSTG